jgi:CheY-like chemotaxis protein
LTNTDLDTRCRILLVDDEEHFRFSATLALKSMGWLVDSAANGLEALEMLLKSRDAGEEYHLVITDILMPGMDGIELLDKMKENGLVVPTLVITGFLDSEYREALQARQISNTLEKPFMPDLLKDVIKGIFFNESDCNC